MWSNTNVIKADHYQVTAVTNLVFGFLLIEILKKMKLDRLISIFFTFSFLHIS